MQLSDDQIIDALRRGEDQGIQWLVEVYLGLIYAVVNKNIGSAGTSQDVEECVNDVLLGIWNNIDKFKETGSFKSWVAAIAKFKAIDASRKALRTKSHEVGDDGEIEQMASHESIENKLVEKETKQALLALLKGLEMQDQELFIRKYFMDEANWEISDKIGLSQSVINNRLSRGRKKLKSWIQGGDGR